LFMGTLDAHFVALEMKTGKVIYDIEMAAAKDGFAATGAPLVVNGKVIAGVAGGEFANRGVLDAYNPATGERMGGYLPMSGTNEIGRDGRPVLNPGQEPTEAGTVTCPGLYGGTNFMSPSLDVARGLFFVTARETCMRYIRRAPAAGATLGALTLGGNAALVS